MLGAAGARLGDGDTAPSLSGLNLDVPLSSTTTHEPTEIPKSLWTGWKSLEKLAF